MIVIAILATAAAFYGFIFGVGLLMVRAITEEWDTKLPAQIAAGFTGALAAVALMILVLSYIWSLV